MARRSLIPFLLLTGIFGCSEETATQPGPPPQDDPNVQGTWVYMGRAIDDTGVLICTYALSRLRFGPYNYLYEVYLPDIGATGDCTTTLFHTKEGAWSIPSTGFIKFSPPLWTDSDVVPYTVENDQLTLVSGLTFDRE